MARNTGIQWCDDTVNPTSGCDGCELYQPPPPGLDAAGLKAWLAKWPCYAAQVHENRLARSFPTNYGTSFSDVRTIPGRLHKCANWVDLTGKERPDKPWLNGLPRLIFISDMSDAFSDAVSFDYLKSEVIAPVMSWQKNRHIGLWLTKRPERMAEFAEWLASHKWTWPSNLWAGTSVTTQPTAEQRIPNLRRVPAPVRFISVEPLRAAVGLKLARINYDAKVDGGAIHWVIVGGESGQLAHKHKLDVEWVRSIIDECGCARAACFVKQLGKAPFTWEPPPGVRAFKYQNMDVPPKWEYHWQLQDSHGGDWAEWPEELRVREMPEVRP